MFGFKQEPMTIEEINKIRKNQGKKHNINDALLQKYKGRENLLVMMADESVEKNLSKGGKKSRKQRKSRKLRKSIKQRK